MNKTAVNVKNKTEDITTLWLMTKPIALAFCKRWFLLYGKAFTRLGLTQEDVLQDAFCILARAVAQYDEKRGASFSTYYYNCLRWEVSKTLALKCKLPLSLSVSLSTPISLQEELCLGDTIEDIEAGNDIEKVLDRAFNEKLRSDIMACLDDMPEECKRVITLKYFNNLPLREIASILCLEKWKVKELERKALRLMSLGSRSVLLSKYRDDIAGSMAYKSSFNRWKNNRGSSTEQTALKMLGERERLGLG